MDDILYAFRPSILKQDETSHGFSNNLNLDLMIIGVKIHTDETVPLLLLLVITVALLCFLCLQHKARVEAMMCDLASFRSVREFADSFKAKKL